EPGRRLANTPIAAERAARLFDQEMEKAKGAAKKNQPLVDLLEQARKNNRPTKNMTPAELTLSIEQAKDEHHKQTAAEEAKKWKDEEEKKWKAEDDKKWEEDGKKWKEEEVRKWKERPNPTPNEGQQKEEERKFKESLEEQWIQKVRPPGRTVAQ